MSKQTIITNWLKQCPVLGTLWNISAYEQDGANVIIPTGTSYRRNLVEKIGADGWYEAEYRPLPTIYEEYQINCYRTIIEDNNEFNALKYDEVEDIIAWITEQDENENFPNVSGNVIGVECFPFIPQVRGVDPDTGLICYYITLRITYVNTTRKRQIECPL